MSRQRRRSPLAAGRTVRRARRGPPARDPRQRARGPPRTRSADLDRTVGRRHPARPAPHAPIPSRARVAARRPRGPSRRHRAAAGAGHLAARRDRRRRGRVAADQQRARPNAAQASREVGDPRRPRRPARPAPGAGADHARPSRPRADRGRGARLGDGRRTDPIGQDHRPRRARDPRMARTRPRDLDQGRRPPAHAPRPLRARRGPRVRPHRRHLPLACGVVAADRVDHMDRRAADRRGAARRRGPPRQPLRRRRVLAPRRGPLPRRAPPRRHQNPGPDDGRRPSLDRHLRLRPADQAPRRNPAR